MVISHEDNIADFSKNKPLDAILQIFYENKHILTTIKNFFFTVLSSVIISGVSFDTVQLLLCLVAQRCWNALGEGIK